MIDLDTLDRAKLDALWPQAAGELRGFARHLERSQMGITASQVWLAVQMAERYYQSLGVAVPDDEVPG